MIFAYSISTSRVTHQPTCVRAVTAVRSNYRQIEIHTRPLPIFMFDANNAGSGKTLLATLGALVSTGDLPVPQVLPTNQEEQRKLVTSLVRHGARTVLLDNHLGDLGGTVLEVLATTRHWQDRLLGANQIYSARFDAVTAITGNNLSLRARDTARRIVPIRLVAHDERPEDRTGFRYPDLMAYANVNKNYFAHAATSIVAAWVQSGAPSMKLPEFGSYTAWAKWVRSPLVWMGLPDPCEARESLSQADTETSALRTLLSALSTLFAEADGRFTVKELLILLDPMLQAGHPTQRESCEAVTDSLASLDGSQATHSPSRLGVVFRKFRERVAGGFRLMHAGTRGGAVIWKVEHVS